MKEAHKRGDDLGLSEDELAFYDALEVNDSAVKVLGDETLQKIAKELVEAVRKNATIDWTVKESARAKLRVIVRRLLRKHGYPPDKQEKATQTVLEQAELLARSGRAESSGPICSGRIEAMITRILHFKDLKAIPISLASLAEQRRIVATLRVNVLETDGSGLSNFA